MNNKEFCVALMKNITEVFLDYTKSQKETLKLITIGVQAALMKKNNDH